MDIPRPGVARSKKIRRILFLIAFIVAASAATYGLSKLRWIPAGRDGLVEKINVRIGDTVSPNTILAELSNPDLLQTLMDSGLQIKAAGADLVNTRTGHENPAIDQQILIANLAAAAQRAGLQADTDDELAKRGLIGQLSVRLSRLEAENSASQVEREKQRVAINAKSAEAQIAAQEARLDQLRTTYEMRKRQIDELKIRAGVSGVLQQLSIESGQRIAAGATICTVTHDPRYARYADRTIHLFDGRIVEENLAGANA